MILIDLGKGRGLRLLGLVLVEELLLGLDQVHHLLHILGVDFLIVDSLMLMLLFELLLRLGYLFLDKDWFLRLNALRGLLAILRHSWLRRRWWGSYFCWKGSWWRRWRYQRLSMSAHINQIDLFS